MGLSKTVELGFRRALLRILRFARRRRAREVRVDFNKCKFLFIRQDRIGDVLVSTPLISSLKQHYPGAIIDVLLSSNNYFVLQNDTAVRKRWVYDKKPVSSIRTLIGIRAEKYDFVVDLMDNPSATSTVILLFAGGKWNVGLEKENSYACDIVVPLLSRKETHIVDRLAKLLGAFGIESEKEQLSIHYQTTRSSDESIGRFLSQHLSGDPKLIGLNISAGSDSRFWGVQQYRTLIDELRSRFGDAKMVVLYKASDLGRAREIGEGETGVVLAPEMTFDEYASMIKHLWLLVTPDTSAVHLAAAFRVPSVVLYVQSDPTLRIWEPYKAECEAVITTGENLSNLKVSQVIEAVQKVTNRIGGRPAKMTTRVDHL